jgi:nucleoid-associated protein YgaU
MSVKVGNSSRLRFAELKKIDGVEFWDTVVLPDYKSTEDDMEYIVESGDRIDLLAARFYRDSRLWWVIAWANDMESLPTDLKEGETITIPSVAALENSGARRGGRF